MTHRPTNDQRKTVKAMSAYVDVAVQRWQDFTGEQAKLEGSGETFSPLLADGS